jgi:hypothetical protein
MLQLGVGLHHDEIFYSSMKGTIPNGEFFVQNIIKELNVADFVIAILSRSYFASHFCLAEAGAALARKASGACEFISLLVPPASFSDLDGILHGVQSGSVIDRPNLSEMKDRLQAKLPNRNLPGSPLWDQKRDDFLHVAQQAVSLYEVKAALPKITVNNYQWKHEPGTPDHKVYVNYKIRINLKNGLSTPIYIESGTWESGSDGIPPFEPSQHLKWRLKELDTEQQSLLVPAGSVFRTWIGLAHDTSCAECLKRSAAKQTGTMHLKLEVGGHLVDHDIRF